MFLLFFFVKVKFSSVLHHSDWFFVCLSAFPIMQETDASLLMITGFPAFAVGDESLCQQTKDMVLEKLEVS